MQRQQPRHREGDKKGEVKHSREGFVRELADKIRNKKKGRVATVTPTVRVEGFWCWWWVWVHWQLYNTVLKNCWIRSTEKPHCRRKKKGKRKVCWRCRWGRIQQRTRPSPQTRPKCKSGQDAPSIIHLICPADPPRCRPLSKVGYFPTRLYRTHSFLRSSRHLIVVCAFLSHFQLQHSIVEATTTQIDATPNVADSITWTPKESARHRNPFRWLPLRKAWKCWRLLVRSFISPTKLKVHIQHSFPFEQKRSLPRRLLGLCWLVGSSLEVEGNMIGDIQCLPPTSHRGPSLRNHSVPVRRVVPNITTALYCTDGYTRQGADGAGISPARCHIHQRLAVKGQKGEPSPGECNAVAISDTPRTLQLFRLTGRYRHPPLQGNVFISQQHRPSPIPSLYRSPDTP